MTTTNSNSRNAEPPAIFLPTAMPKSLRPDLYDRITAASPKELDAVLERIEREKKEPRNDAV